MNIYKVVRNTPCKPCGKSVAIKITYTHSAIVGYNSQGRAIRENQTMVQTFIGCNRKEAERYAINFLKNEKWEAERQVASKPQVILRGYAR